MLGKLATYLRMCGYDAAYALDRGIEDDERLREIAAEEDRTLLTRDEQLADRTPDALLLTEQAVTDQLRELVDAGFDLSLADPPVRCGSCNGLLERVAHTGRQSAGERVAHTGRQSAGERVAHTGRQSAGERVDDEPTPEHVPDDEMVFRCRDCGQWFWRGSHWDDVEQRLASL
ncbi:MAG: Mut7-C RNAse domain-containing protein [Halolamina sp.]